MQLPPHAYGPALPNASDLGHGVTVRGHASNAGRARQNRPTATLSVPF
jgi:hypothetical protein